MGQSVNGTFETKQINELTELAKLTRNDYVLVDHEGDTYKTSVDTLLGYIRDEINEGKGSTGKGDTTINIIPIDGEDIPAESRATDNFYLKVGRVYTKS